MKDSLKFWYRCFYSQANKLATYAIIHKNGKTNIKFKQQNKIFDTYVTQ